MISRASDSKPIILVTGATGYVGGRIVPRLLAKGYRVKCMARDISRLEGRWLGVELVEADALDRNSLDQALVGVERAYYLIHSMGASSSNFSTRDKIAAENFGEAAKKNGVRQIVYLGGLCDDSQNLSQHFRSRLNTGKSLRASGVPVTELRAGVVIGSGSLSFEMLRYLTERLPVMICPKWVKTKTQPIGIRDVLDYLIEAIENTEAEGKTFEIGGKDILTYAEMMKTYARLRKLRRFLIHVPFLTPRLSSLWVNFVTPVPNCIARPLIESITNEVICRDHSALRVFKVRPMGFEEAMTKALLRIEKGDVETLWSTNLITENEPHSKRLQVHEGFLFDERRMTAQSSAATSFSVLLELGGDRGWPYLNFLWKIRAAIDWCMGGVGYRRGRRSPTELRHGDALDFWRVEKFEVNKLLRLRAEMKVPGRAWLQFRIQEISEDQSIVIQTAFFDAKGLWGHLYWYFLYPIHEIMFAGMIRKIVELSEEKTRQHAPTRI